MKLTVAICTWNRAALLDQTLDAMTRLRVPAGAEWELLVVNNNCTDATDEVLAKYVKRLPLTCCNEPRPGLSHARNHAVGVASGDYLLWTDDDVLVDEDWLGAYHRAFLRWPEAAVFGGPVQPWFAGTPPRWLRQVFPRVAAAYAAVDFGAAPLLFGEESLPFGANLAVRMAEQKRHPFNPRLGVAPGRRMGGEETVVVQAILREGASGLYVPDARVRHYIPVERQTLRYLRDFYYGVGQFDGRHSAPLAGRTWWGRPRWRLRQAMQRELRFHFGRWLTRPGVWMDDLMAASRAWGFLNSYAARSALG